MRNLLLSLLTLFLFGACTRESFRQNLSYEQPVSDFRGIVDSIVVSTMNQYHIPGLAVGIVKNDSLIYTRGYGVRDINQAKAVRAQTVFHTASVSKLFTASAILELMKSGNLSLDTRLLAILPDLHLDDPRGQKITLQHLLNHTSGLPDVQNYRWKDQNQSEKSLEQYVMSLNLRLKSEPGTQYAYSNLAYELLGLVVARTTKITFEDYVKSQILEPVGMKNSDFRYFKIPDSLRTSPHTKVGKQIKVRETYPYTREHAPSSTLNASAMDLSRWMIAFFQALEENPDTYYHQMIRPSFAPYIGLGFQLYKFDQYKAVGHFGGDRGFRSFLMMIPARKIGLVVLANADFAEDFRQEIVYAIAEIMLNKI